MKKKSILWSVITLTILALLVSVMFFGCKTTTGVEEPTAVTSAAETAAGETTAAETTESAKPVVLTLWAQNHGPLIERIKVIMDSYMKANPNVEIRLTQIPWNEMQTVVATNLVAGTGPDIFTNWDVWISTWVHQNTLAPVDYSAMGYDSMETLIGDYIPGSLDSASFDGVVYGVPYEIQLAQLYINTKYFQEAGYDTAKDWPETWDQFMEQCQKMTKVDSSGAYTVEGYDVFYNGGLVTPRFIGTMLSKCGGGFYNADFTESIINNEAGVLAFTKLQELYTKYKVGSPKYGMIVPGFGELDWCEGEQATLLAGSFIADMVPDYPAVKDNWEMGPVPEIVPGVKTDQMENWFWSVPKSSNNQAEAWKFIDAVSSDPIYWMDGFFGVAPRLLKQDYPNGWWTTPEFESIKPKGFDGFWKAVNDATLTTYVGPYNVVELGNIVYKYEQKIMLEQADVKTSLDQCKAELDQLLKDF